MIHMFAAYRVQYMTKDSFHQFEIDLSLTDGLNLILSMIQYNPHIIEIQLIDNSDNKIMNSHRNEK